MLFWQENESVVHQGRPFGRILAGFWMFCRSVALARRRMIEFIAHFICKFARGCLPVAAHAALGMSAHPSMARFGMTSGREESLYAKDFPQKPLIR